MGKASFHQQLQFAARSQPIRPASPDFHAETIEFNVPDAPIGIQRLRDVHRMLQAATRAQLCRLSSGQQDQFIADVKIILQHAAWRFIFIADTDSWTIRLRVSRCAAVMC